jgi:uncharacterized protein (TIGR03067 family)
MNPVFSPLFLAVLLPAAPALKEKPGGADRAALQGTWRMAGCTYSGRTVPADTLADAAIEFRDNQLAAVQVPVITIRAGGAVSYDIQPGGDFRFILDPGGRPGWIDLERQTKDGVKKYAGIYQLDGDRLRICYGTDARPTEFESGDKSGRVLWHLRRARR